MAIGAIPWPSKKAYLELHHIEDPKTWLDIIHSLDMTFITTVTELREKQRETKNG